MKYFFLDTSNSRLIVAIYKNKSKLAYYNEHCENNLSKKIMPIIDNVFKEAKIQPSEIDKIFVVNGPGSFTGLRIGLAIAKTFAWSFNIDIIPISSLELLATTKCRGNYTVPLIDARRGFVYAGVYDKNLNSVRADKYLKFDELIKSLSNSKYSLVTYDEKITSQKIVYPNVSISTLIKKHMDDKPVNPHYVNPNYLKLTEAEEKLNDKTSSNI